MPAAVSAVAEVSPLSCDLRLVRCARLERQPGKPRKPARKPVAVAGRTTIYYPYINHKPRRKTAQPYIFDIALFEFFCCSFWGSLSSTYLKRYPVEVHYLKNSVVLRAVSLPWYLKPF